MPDITFLGPVGRLEGKYFPANNGSQSIALVMHPHPEHGGTMNNKVTYKIYESFAKAGFSVLRFNFRGVGNSQGTFDNGVGEMSDAAAALDWLCAQNPNAKNIWIAGFSFGAWVMLQLLVRRPDVTRFVAVSPPTDMFDFGFVSPCHKSGLFINGSDDVIAKAEKTEELLSKIEKQKGVKLHYSKITGAEHFYTDHQEQLGNTILRYINSQKNLD